MLAALALQLYNPQISVGFAREVAIAPPLPVTTDSKFKVQIFNGTKKPVKLLTENCSWGYIALSFELKSPSGKIFPITRETGEWYRNVPTATEVESVGSMIRKINFGDQTWSGFPTGIGSQLDGWEVRVRYSVKPNKQFENSGIWIGEIVSGWTPAKPAN